MADYHEGQEYLAARCKNCGKEQGKHLTSSVPHYLCPMPLTTHFEARPGDEWCGWCDDWLVNCNCDEKGPDERLE